MKIYGLGLPVRFAKEEAIQKKQNESPEGIDHSLFKKIDTSNYRAYYLSKNNVSFGTSAPSTEEVEEKRGAQITVGSFPSFKDPLDLTDIAYYEDTVNQIALSLSADKKVNLIYDEGALSQFIPETFTRMLKRGLFTNAGLTPQNTEVMTINAGDCMLTNGKAVNPLIHFHSISKHNGKKSVVFVEDYQTFNLDNNGGLPGTINPFIFTSNFMKDINLVFMTPSNQEAVISDAQKNNIREVRLSSINPDEARKLIYEEPAIHKLIDETRRIDITKDAINEAVKITETTKGELPGKAINILKMAIANKSIETNGKVEKITPSDVRKVFEKYPELRESKKSGSGKYEVIHKTGVTLNDVGGISTIKKEIKDELLAYLNKPNLSSEEKKDIPKGIMLFGPPGTGKTLLAKAIAGEAGVPFISASGSSFVEKFVGVGAQRVRELFSLARSEASKSPTRTAIVFIDEIDAVAKKRSSNTSGGDSEYAQTLNQLLTEMDGLKNDNTCKIVVIGATNRKDTMDEAILRAGRMDMHFEIPNPASDKEARYEILKIHGKKRPFENEEAKETILKELANATSGLSGADLENLLKKANRIVRKRGSEKPYITINDLKEAELQIKYGPVTKVDLPNWEVASVIGHECGHGINSIVVSKLYGENTPWNQQNMEINAVLLQPRGKSLGSVTFNINDKNGDTFESFIGYLAMAYGGFSYEEISHGSHMTGVSGDLKQVTRTAYNAVTKYGMGPNTGAISTDGLPDNKEIPAGVHENIMKDVKLLTDTAKKVSDLIIEFHKPFIEKFVEKYKDVSGKGGNVLSADEFKKQYETWINDNKSEFEVEKLNQDIRQIIDSAKQKKDLISEKAVA